MNADKLQRLEKNKKFRKTFYAKEVWKNYAIVPPSVILFASLFGILFLFNLDQLVSLYVIPCLILLILSTIWLKSVRKYIVTQNVSDDKTFLICLSIPLMCKDGKTIFMFSIGHNRHNKNYLEKRKKEILESISGDFDYVDQTSKPGLHLIPETDIYMLTPLFSDRITNRGNKQVVNRYVIFNGSEKVRNVNLRELESFSC